LVRGVVPSFLITPHKSGNVTMSALTEATVIVEAGETSGTLKATSQCTPWS